MPIKALPATTTQLLGSTQIIVDPVSAIKELIDNALDAKATSILVEAAPNLLDIIQVRDNGHGIAPEDRVMLCQKYCTSKIRQYSDIETIASSSLGFRGEALACIADVCRGFAVVTRTKDEEVACRLVRNGSSFKPPEKASNPIGTTIRLEELFSRLPVRRQSAVGPNVVSRNIVKLRSSLKAYAFARPEVRFSLKIIGSKNPKDDWIYVPGLTSELRDVAFKITGKDCAAQCNSTCITAHGITIAALLPRLDGDLTKIKHIGGYICIDQRPVAATRGVLLQIAKKIKSRLRDLADATADLPNPFFCFKVSCPPGSYDPNIEPAKDDLLFHEPEKLLLTVESLMDQYFSSNVAEDIGDHHPRGISLHTDRASLQGRDMIESNMAYATAEHEEMLVDVPVEVFQDDGADQDDEETVAGLQDVQISNPWIFAKWNASSPNRTSAQKNVLPHLQPLRERNNLQERRDHVKCSPDKGCSFTPPLQTGIASPSFPEPVVYASPGVAEAESMSSIGIDSSPSGRLEQRHLSFAASNNNPALRKDPSNVLNYPRALTLSRSPLRLAASREANESSILESASGSPQRFPRSQTRKRKVANRPFVSPVKEPENLWFGRLPLKSSPADHRQLQPSGNARSPGKAIRGLMIPRSPGKLPNSFSQGTTAEHGAGIPLPTNQVPRAPQNLHNGKENENETVTEEDDYDSDGTMEAVNALAQLNHFQRPMNGTGLGRAPQINHNVLPSLRPTASYQPVIAAEALSYTPLPHVLPKSVPEQDADATRHANDRTLDWKSQGQSHLVQTLHCCLEDMKHLMLMFQTYLETLPPNTEPSWDKAAVQSQSYADGSGNASILGTDASAEEVEAWRRELTRYLEVANGPLGEFMPDVVGAVERHVHTFS